MESKKQIFFKLIEIDKTLFNILYTLLCVVVLAVLAVSMMIATNQLYGCVECDELNYKEWIGLIITGLILVFVGVKLLKNYYP